MIHYSDLTTANTTISGGITPIDAVDIGTHISKSEPAEVGTFKAYGFETIEGNLYNCDPSLGDGSGSLTKTSESLFPITGDGKPRTIDVQVIEVTNGNFQLGVVTETAWPLPDQFFVGADGSKPDTTLWTYDSALNIYIQSNQLRLYTQTGDPNTVHVMVTSKFVLEGDFDVSVRHAYRSGNSDNYLSSLFHILTVNHSSSVAGQDWYFRHYWDSSQYIYHCTAESLSSSDWTSMVEVPSSSYSVPNYYRSTRVGNVGSLYTSEDGTNWSLLYSGTGFSTDPVYMYLDTYRYNMAVPLYNIWDNLKIAADKVTL